MGQDSAATVLGEFIANVRMADFGADTLHLVRRHVLDTFGAGLVGTASLEGRIIVEATPSCGEGVIWGSRAHRDSARAALVNGTHAHAFELDDTGGVDHSGAVVVPAVSASTTDATDGESFICGVLIGYEIGKRVLESVGGYDSHNGLGWHSTGTCGSFAAAAGASRALRLDAAGVTASLGLAGSFTGGVWAFLEDGSMAKRLTAGRAIESGTLSAELAARGFTGPRNIFEADWGGFLTTYGRASGQAAAEGASELVRDLGREWRIHQAAIKPYASCRGTHSAIEAMLDLRSRHRLRPADVASIAVRTTPSIVQMCGGHGFSTIVAAQMSMPVALALALEEGGVEASSFTLSIGLNPSIQRIVETVTLVPESTLPSGAAVVEVTCADGRLLEARVDDALGSPSHPLSDTALVKKFLKLAEGVIPRAQAEELVDAVWTLGKDSDVRHLLALLVPEIGPDS